MKVICISGKAQHGKDTSAIILKDRLEADGHSVLITHYGDLLKYICKAFFEWNGEKDTFGRSLLQDIGTGVIRAKIPDFWIDFLLSILNLFPNEWDYVLIPDCRFPNEVAKIQEVFKENVTHLRIKRLYFDSPLTPE